MAEIERNTFICSDCLEAMRKMPDSSVDAVVTDPPYSLSFMGKGWDKALPGVPYWREALRVAKPGAYLLAFGGTRTFHRLACFIEDAGWEIRDDIAFLSSLSNKEREFFQSLTSDQQQAFLDLFASQKLLGWAYGSGFPKSLDVSKNIDKAAGAERPVLREYDPRGLYDKRSRESKAINTNWRKSEGREDFSDMSKKAITIPVSKHAKKWDGWGTALKPAFEPIIVARKPLEGTVAANVLKYGTGGINIDGCRIKGKSWGSRPAIRLTSKGKTGGGFGQTSWKSIPGKRNEDKGIGRWPANIIHDGSPEVLSVFPESKGQQGDLIKHNKNRKSPHGCYGEMASANDHMKRGDSGSAARFFYCAKASKRERNIGCENLPEKEVGHNRFDKCETCGGYILQNQDRPSACKCENPVRKHNIIKGNTHPTLKPLALMRYLVRLVTPPKGIVLDPFCGSGTTALACIDEGCSFICIDNKAEYIEIAKKREEGRRGRRPEIKSELW